MLPLGGEYTDRSARSEGRELDQENLAATILPEQLHGKTFLPGKKEDSHICTSLLS